MKANGTRACCSIVLGASCALPPVCPSVLPLPLTLSSFHFCAALHAITLLCLVLLQRDPQLQIIRDEKRDRKILLPAHDLGRLLPMFDICCNNVLLLCIARQGYDIFLALVQLHYILASLFYHVEHMPFHCNTVDLFFCHIWQMVC